jgi:hypothetical protein
VFGALTVVPLSAADLYTKAPPAVIALPAVDGINWKFDGFGGSLADHGLYAGRGAVTIPLGSGWGVQIDGAAGSFDDRFFGAVAGHLFTRDPSRGLIGLYASHTYLDNYGGVRVSQVAGEAEAYLGRWTLQGIAGVEAGNSGTQVTTVIHDPFITTHTATFDIQTRFFDAINIAYYLTDNLKAFAGHRYFGGRHAAAFGGEYGIPLGNRRMVSLFAEGRIGEDDYHGVWGGLRVYFGQKDKSLIRRHREDDPLSDWIPETLHSITNQLQNSSRTWCLNGETVQSGCTL